jgi:hypothetical protein
MQALLDQGPGSRTVVLLGNFEDLVDAETQAIKDRGTRRGATRPAVWTFAEGRHSAQGFNL